MISALYRLPAPDGALLLLCRLYDDVEDQEAIAAWEEGRTDLPPFCWRLAGGDYKPLQAAMDRGRSSVTSHLAALTELGVIRRAKRDGRSGWELLGTREAPETSGDSDVDVRAAGRCGPKNLTATSGEPDVPPTRGVRAAGPPGPPRRTSTSKSPDAARAHEGFKREPDLARRGGAANDRPGRAPAPAPSSTATSARAAPAREPPRPASPQAPARTLLLDLVRRFDALFVPTVDGRPVGLGGTPLESRRIRPDTETLRKLTELLTPPEDVDGDAWVERQVATVAGYVRDYAAICAVDPEQARQWGGDMLEPRIRKGTRSAWDTLTRIVDRWREDQAAAAAAAHEAAAEAGRAEARAVAERLIELEQLARHGEPAFARELRATGQAAPPRRDHVADHAAALAAVAAARAAGRAPTLAAVDAAVAGVPALAPEPEPDAPARPDTAAIFLDSPVTTSSVTPLPPLPPMQHVGEPPVRELSEDEEAAIRGRGSSREDQAARAGDVELHIRQRINAAFKSFTERCGRSPTPEQAEQIRRRIRGEEEATGT